MPPPPVKQTSDFERQLKLAFMQIGAGGSAGFIEVCIMHPLDLIKTRLQLQSLDKKKVKSDDRHNYRGIIDCVRKMYRNEGLFSYYKGLIPPILAETPKRAVKFLTFEQFKRFFLFGAPKPTPLTFSLAGLSAGITEAILVNPFEVVKINMQANRATKESSPSTFAVTRQIIREHGFGSQGLYKGVAATVARNGCFNMVYFGFYHSVKGLLPVEKDPKAEFLSKCAIGFTSGTLASCFNIPFDVVKSRIQGPQPTPGQVKYHGVLRTLGIVYREEGFLALYKGLLPKVLRLGPGGAIMLVTFDYVYTFLMNSFDIKPDLYN